MYIPVSPDVLSEFDNAKVSIIARHSIVNLETMDEGETCQRIFPSKRKFTDPLQCLQFIHTIHRIIGFEMLRGCCESSFPELAEFFDIFQVKIRIYDKKQRPIFKCEYTSKAEIDYEYVTSAGRYKVQTHITKRLEDIIPSTRLVPFGSPGIQLCKGSSWVYLDDIGHKYNYGKNQFVYMNDFRAFYLAEDKTISKLAEMIDSATKIDISMFAITYLDLKEVGPGYDNQSLSGMIDSGDLPYRAEIIYNDLFNSKDRSTLIEFFIWFSCIADYSILELAKCAYEDDDRYTFILKIKVESKKTRAPREFCIPYSKYTSFKSLVKGILS